MKYRHFTMLIILLFSNFVWAQDEIADGTNMSVNCNLQNILFKNAVPYDDYPQVLTIVSRRTGIETEILCMGQCSIDKWACVSVDNIPYLLFRGTNAERYTVGPVEGHEYIAHWALQLNEVDWKVSLKHKHAQEMSNFLNMLDRTRDTQLIFRPFVGLDYGETIRRSKYGKLAREKYPHISKIYESAQFSPFDFQ